MDRPLTVILNERIQIFHEYRSRALSTGTDVKAGGGLLSEYRGPGAKTTEVEAREELVCASTDDGRNLAHDFGVKLSPCMCSHVSCPGWGTRLALAYSRQ